MNIELTPEQEDMVVLQVLIATLHLDEYTGDDALSRAMNVVLAYYSVPGTWKEGMYDS
jgi:hypothetical protein